jgi:glycosyltransferase involved in cell wall biosynthesis
VESCLRQTYPEVEVIVVDDGSPDHTLAEARAFEPRIRVLTGPNRGANAARNRGIGLATGAFLQFLDADDLLHPEKLERQVAALSAGDADLVYADYEVVEPDGHTRSTQGMPDIGDGDPVCALLLHRLQTSAPLHRTENVRRVGGFRPGLKASQERDLHLRLAMSGLRFRKVPGALHTVRKQRTSISSDYVHVLRQRRHWVVPAYDTLAEEGALTDDRRRAFAEMMALSARELIQLGEYRLGRAYLAEARRMHPGDPLADWSTKRRVAYRLLGPVMAEKLLALKKSVE